MRFFLIVVTLAVVESAFAHSGHTPFIFDSAGTALVHYLTSWVHFLTVAGSLVLVVVSARLVLLGHLPDSTRSATCALAALALMTGLFQMAAL